MWWKIIIVTFFVLAFVIIVVILYGRIRWQKDIRELLAKIEATREPITPNSFDPCETEGLPPPVQRYFRAILIEGNPLVSSVRMEHTGTFNMSETGEQWKSFKSSQHIITQRPGFIWDARIKMAPAVAISVYDAYVAGEGLLTAKIFGLFTVMKQPSTAELAQGEFLRFFAETLWYPTALLPSQGVFWEAIDDTSASATLNDGSKTIKMVFQFDSQDLIIAVRSEGRYRDVDGTPVPTPWEGRFWNYEKRNGMLIPIDGEVAWLLEEGPKPYWRGHIQAIEYEFAK